MASRLPHFSTLFCFILILSPLTQAIDSSLLGTSPDAICDSTPHPAFCKSLLPRNKSHSTIQDYGRYCMIQSISDAHLFLSLVDRLLELPSQFSQSTIRALEDCQFLAARNIEFLSTANASTGSSNTTIRASEAALVWSVLSATITNLETCSDGLIQASGSNSILGSYLGPYLSNGTFIYSITLALVTQGWASRSIKVQRLGQKGPVFFHGEDEMRHWPSRSSGRAGDNVDLHKRHGRVRAHGSRARKGSRSLQLGGLNVQVNTLVTVNTDGSGNFSTISDAILAAPNNTKPDSGYFAIHVVAGVYEEYVSVLSNKQYLLMVGDGINKTIITGNRSVVDGWTTFDCATFVNLPSFNIAVAAEGFLAVNITFRNTAGAIKEQAVAVRNGADLSTFYKCSFEAYQDTLYTHSLRQFYKECDVYGTIDFIFGNAAVVFQDCNIFLRQPLQGQFNAITAQGRTDPNQNTGTSIQGAIITAAPDLAMSNFTVQNYLGRPWKEYSRTVFMQSYMGSLINPGGWSEWSEDFALDTLYYAEYNNTGPGSNTTDRVTWSGYHIINATDAINFTVSKFISGDNWLPATGVPYTGGLL